jgi:hypothetical protein
MTDNVLDNPSLRSCLAGIADAIGSDLEGMRCEPREEVLMRYTRGSGQFSPDKRFINLKMQMYTTAGEQDGYHDGVWEALFKDPLELLGRPPAPSGAMNQAQGPVPHPDPVAATKGIWAFGDGSSITAVGPALSHLMVLSDGSFLFSVTCAQIITNGEGRYEGAYGLKTSLGSTWIPAGTNLFGPGDVKFVATTIDTFRVVRSRYIKGS